jgi:hypothetical protein
MLSIAVPSNTGQAQRTKVQAVCRGIKATVEGKACRAGRLQAAAHVAASVSVRA